jgi:hypothetical protein
MAEIYIAELGGEIDRYQRRPISEAEAEVRGLANNGLAINEDAVSGAEGASQKASGRAGHAVEYVADYAAKGAYSTLPAA